MCNDGFYACLSEPQGVSRTFLHFRGTTFLETAVSPNSGKQKPLFPMGPVIKYLTE